VSLEHNGGEIPHGDAKGRTYAFVLGNANGFWPGLSLCVQVSPERFRIPDVVIMRGGRPEGRIIRAAPEVAVEVLSPEARASAVQEKIDDYLAFDVKAVWIIDPVRQRAWVHTNTGSQEAVDRVLRNPAGDLEVPLSAVFAD
jgi:Uma2 family endonuclease